MGCHTKGGVVRERGRGRTLLSPPKSPTEAEEEAGQGAQEVGQADAVGRAALWTRSVGAVEEVSVVEGLGMWMVTTGSCRPCAKCSPCLKSLILIVTHPGGARAATRHSHRAIGQLAQDHTALGKRQGGIQELGNHSVASRDEGGGVSVPQMWTPSSSVLCTPTPAGCWGPWTCVPGSGPCILAAASL